jgi:hypothetical protein
MYLSQGPHGGGSEEINASVGIGHYAATHIHKVLEAVRENRVKIRYVNAKKMKADGLTKSLEGAGGRFSRIYQRGMEPL